MKEKELNKYGISKLYKYFCFEFSNATLLSAILFLFELNG